LLTVISTPENIFADSAQSLRIYICGLIFLFLYNAATSIYNGLGDSRTPLCFLIFSSVLNVLLDLLFVSRLGMGVAGLAWATFIAQGISALLATGTLIVRVRRIPTRGRIEVWNRGLLLSMMVVAIPSICQQSFVSIGVFLVQGIVNSFGSDTVAAFSAALKVSTFALMVMNTLPNSLSNFASQNIGARELDRVRQGLHISIVIAEIVILSVNVLFFCAADRILSLFIPASQGTEVIQIGVRFLHTLCPFYFLIGVKNCCDSVLRGGGAMKAFMATTFSDLLLRIAFSYAFAGALGFSAICWAYPVGWIVGTALSIWFYRRGVWMEIPDPFEKEIRKKPERRRMFRRKKA
ncbi:MAG: MATE family efflux transporter, partial [Butyricicoccaceae bacterium]